MAITNTEQRLGAAAENALYKLEKELEKCGAGDWEAVIIAYHPEESDAWIISETKGASLNRCRKLLKELEGA